MKAKKGFRNEEKYTFDNFMEYRGGIQQFF